MQVLKYQTTLGERIRRILEVISPILVDGNLTFDKHGLSIQGMTDKVFVKLNLPQSGAESYQSWEEKTSIGLDFKCLSGWLKAVNKGDIISFEVSKEELEGTSPTLTYKHWNDKMNHEVRLPILDIEDFKAEDKETEYDSILTLSSNELEDFVKRHGVGATHLRFRSFHNPPTASGTIRTFLVLHSFGLTPGETTKPCFIPNFTGKYSNRNVPCAKDDIYSIKTLKTITKAYTVSDSVNIHLSKNPHILLRYQLGQLGALEFRVVPEAAPEEAKTKPAKPAKRKAASPTRKRKKAKVAKKEKKPSKLHDFLVKLEKKRLQVQMLSRPLGANGIAIVEELNRLEERFIKEGAKGNIKPGDVEAACIAAETPRV